MKVPIKLSVRKVFKAISKIEEQMLIVVDETTHEENQSQPLQTTFERMKIDVTFLTAYIRLFKVKNTIKITLQYQLLEMVFTKQQICQGFMSLRV